VARSLTPAAGRVTSERAPVVILSREAAAVILSREAAAVILSREATKGSLSIQGFYGRGAKAILSALRASG